MVRLLGWYELLQFAQLATLELAVRIVLLVTTELVTTEFVTMELDTRELVTMEFFTMELAAVTESNDI